MHQIKSVFEVSFLSGDEVQTINLLAIDLDEAIKKAREEGSKKFKDSTISGVRFICEIDVE